MEQIVLNENDEIVMKLLYYFITKEGYSPIVLHGAKDEIWLEKLDGNYKIVRIVSNYIHNDEQLDFDLFKTKQIIKKIKKKTFSFNINTLSLFLNLGDNVHMDEREYNNVDCANIKKMNDLKKYQFIIDEFPTITKEMTMKEKGMELFLKITKDITNKNEQEAKKAEDVFTKRKPYITFILIAINAIIFVLSNINVDILNKLFLAPNIEGEYYRLITSVFTHYNAFHFLFNMYALYIVGPQIENFFGRIKYLIIYLGSGIIASLMSLTFLNGAGSLGASGAIFGLFGSLLYFGYHYRLYLGSILKSQLIPLILLNLMIGFIIPGIDNAAHIGGLVGGITLSMAIGVKYKSSNIDRVNGIILSVILVAFLIYTAFYTI